MIVHRINGGLAMTWVLLANRIYERHHRFDFSWRTGLQGRIRDCLQVFL